MTETDQAIEEVRRTRKRLSEECRHDVSRVIERLQEANRRYAAQVRKYQESHPAFAPVDDTRG